MRPLRSFVAPALACALALAALAPVALAVVLPPVFSTQWGGLGAGPGQFSNPWGIAVDGAGNVYVADTGNNRVQKFDANGVFITQWGGAGSGNGQFSGPRGICTRANLVFVVDGGNSRVQVFSPSGAYLYQFGTAGTGNGQFSNPRGIGMTGWGDVYVVDSGNNRIQQFSTAGAYMGQWGSLGAAAGQFNAPMGLAIDPFTSTIYVADSGNNRIQQFAGGGFFVAQAGVTGAGPGQFVQPTDVALDNGHLYVVDRGNNRVQMFDGSLNYEAQWGVAGLGPGQFTQARGVGALFGIVYVSDQGESCRIQKFVAAPPETCAACASPPDNCCEAFPHVGGPWTNILVGTRQGWNPGYPYAVTIFDLTVPPPVPLEDNNWASMTRYNGPGNTWTIDSLGTVFGLTLDEFGNILTTHSSCYSPDQVGGIFGANSGAIYRIDSNTGAMNVFCSLPNLPDPGVTVPGENLPGLGNITYDCDHHQFFVTNLEDGKIYRIQAVGVNGPTGTVVQTFDPMTPDNGLPGWAPLGERLWGIQWHGNRVYYAVWRQDAAATAGPNEIRSVGLLPSGAIDPTTDQHEFFTPPYVGGGSGGGGAGGGNPIQSMPVADISFSASGRMVIGERGMYGETQTSPHTARVLEYVCSGGCWIPGNTYLVGDYGNRTNASGGVDYDRHPFGGGVIGRLWATGDALHLGGLYTDTVYGYQGLRPNVNGSNLNSILLDSDGNVANGDKTLVGDIEAPGCPEATFGSICGQKFKDVNHNGVKDGGEPGLAGWVITLNGPGGPYTATTDAAGNYCFATLPPGAYTIAEVNQSGWVQTAPTGGTYAVNLAAGQAVYAQDFGNYFEQQGGIPCAPPPLGMGAWWPFNQPLSATSAIDVTHTSPPKNVAGLNGGAAIAAAGYVSQALCFTGEADFAVVPNANQSGINFGSGPFAIDVWVKAGPGGTPRIVAEKRRLIGTSPYRTVGWALYLNNLTPTLEIGNGLSTQVFGGPAIPANTWTHLAVSVSRSPASGTWYLNGAAQAAYNFVAAAGSVSNTADLYMGRTSPAFTFGAITPFGGCIDELELFASTLTAAQVASVYNAGVIGKCPEYCRVPQVTSICKDKTSVQVCFSICNNFPTAQTYTWSLAGLPSGPGCTVAGPTSFSPPGGTVTVAGGTCSAPICVTIARPAGLTAQNATACYTLTFMNNATGVTHSCSGTIRADNTCWCVTAPSGVNPVVGRIQPGSIGTPIVIGVGGPCDPTSFPYKLTAVYTGASSGGTDPLYVSLNGLPPGEPVIGTFQASDPAGGGTIQVGAAYAQHDAAAPYEILLEADLDGDGTMEQVASTMIASTYDGSDALAAPAPPKPVDSVRLLASPNPFFGGSSVAFSLAEKGDVDLAVYDLGGRRVKTLATGTLAAGAHRYEWNGADDHGRPVAAGVYFARLDTPRMEIRAKLVKLR